MRKPFYLFFLALLVMVLSACSDNDVLKKNIVGNPLHTKENPYTSEEAVKNGDVVGGQENMDRFYEFLENVEAGKADVIRVTYYTLEGAPIYHNLVFNERIEYTYDYTQDGFSASNNGPDSIQSTYCAGVIRDTTEEEAYILTGCEYEHIGSNFRLVVNN